MTVFRRGEGGWDVGWWTLVVARRGGYSIVGFVVARCVLKCNDWGFLPIAEDFRECNAVYPLNPGHHEAHVHDNFLATAGQTRKYYGF